MVGTDGFFRSDSKSGDVGFVDLEGEAGRWHVSGCTAEGHMSTICIRMFLWLYLHLKLNPKKHPELFSRAFAVSILVSRRHVLRRSRGEHEHLSHNMRSPQPPSYAM